MNYFNQGTHGTGSRSYTRDRGAFGPESGPLAWDYMTPQEFGAVGDGIADDTVAIQAALDAAADAQGAVLYFPGNHFTYRISSTLIIGIWNKGANTLKVYPPANAEIETLGIDVADTIPAGANKTYVGISATQYYIRT